MVIGNIGAHFCTFNDGYYFFYIIGNAFLGLGWLAQVGTAYWLFRAELIFGSLYDGT
jgi:hypothetical protein